MIAKAISSQRKGMGRIYQRSSWLWQSFKMKPHTIVVRCRVLFEEGVMIFSRDDSSDR